MITSNFSVVLSRGFSAAIQFTIVLFYGANLSVVGFGELSILMIIIGISYGIIDFGTANSILTTTIRKNVSNGLQLLNFFIAVCLGIALFLISVYGKTYFDFSDGFFQALSMVPAVFIIFSCTIVPYSRLHKAQRLKNLALVDFVPVVSMLITVPLFLYFKFGLSTLIFSLGVQVSLRFLMLRYFYGRLIRFRINQDLPKVALVRQYTSNLIIYLTSKLDQIMVASFLSLEILGEFGFLKQVLNYPVSLLIAIYTQISFPYFSRYRRIRLKIRKRLIISITLLLGLVLIYFSLLILIPPKLIIDLIPIWDFRSDVAILVMILSFSRVIFEALSAMSIAVGLIARQLSVNLFHLSITAVFGLLLPLIGLNYYLVSLSTFAILISVFVYKFAFSRVNRY